MKKIGFTGTQIGMTDSQKYHLDVYLRQWGLNGFEEIEFHHGDCIGADAEAHLIAKQNGCRVVIHPPVNSAKRAFCVLAEGDEILESLPYLERNHAIVDSVQLMFGAPKGLEELRSGTWATIRYTKKKKKQLKILYP